MKYFSLLSRCCSTNLRFLGRGLGTQVEGVYLLEKSLDDLEMAMEDGFVDVLRIFVGPMCVLQRVD